MSYSFSKTSLKRRHGVDHRLVEISDLAIKLSPIDFGIPEYGGLRSSDDQAYLHSNGSSPHCDGYINKSYHQSARALDVYAYVAGKASWETEHLAVVAAAMLQAASTLGYKLEWGGLWPWDKPHFQLAKEEA